MLLLSTYWKRKIRYLCHMSHAVPANPGTRESNRCFFALSHTRFIKWNNIDEKWLALRDLCSQDSIWNLNAIQSQLHFITVLLLHCSSASFVRSWGAKREINGCIIQASWLELKIQSMYYYLDFDVNISISVLGIYLSFGLRPELFFFFQHSSILWFALPWLCHALWTFSEGARVTFSLPRFIVFESECTYCQFQFTSCSVPHHVDCCIFFLNPFFILCSLWDW